MNYFAHGRPFIADPYFLAGTAVPDWLNVVDRRVRARAKTIGPFAADADPRAAALARGILQHHLDDDWFHNTQAFAEVSLTLTARVRDALPADDGFRPSFLGHILVELLLDAELIVEQPALLQRYYGALAALDATRVEAMLARMTACPVRGLATFIPRFVEARFLADYSDDQRLWSRLNQVMQRVGLPQLPATLTALFPAARRLVRRRRGELLPPTEPSCAARRA